MTRQKARKIIFHCGYPKTATTTLQTHVFPHLAGVTYIGKRYDTSGKHQRDLCNRLRHCPDSFSLGDTVTQGIVDHLRDAIKKAETTVLISYEEVMAATLHPGVGQGRFGRPLPVRSAAQQFRYIHDLVREAGGVTPRILIVVREQGEFLPSFYAEAYRATFSHIRGLTSFSDYVDELLERRTALLDPAALDYCSVEDACVREFGARNVKFLPYAGMTERQESFVREVSGVLDCEESEFRRLLADSKHENDRRLPGRPTIFKVNRKSVADQVSMMKRSIIPNVDLRLGNVVYPALSRLKLGRSQVAPTERELRRIREFYRKSNDEFARRHPEFAMGKA